MGEGRQMSSSHVKSPSRHAWSTGRQGKAVAEGKNLQGQGVVGRKVVCGRCVVAGKGWERVQVGKGGRKVWCGEGQAVVGRAVGNGGF